VKIVYFVYQDQLAASRQSDGVELCVIPEIFDEKIYFYCSEYAVFWSNIDEVGDFQKTFNFKPKNEIRPASLSEICANELCGYVSSIKEYHIEAGKLKGVAYIHLGRI
jgi:hypothetical protein